MKEENTYTRSEIYNIISNTIKQEMENKNRYIELNGYAHKDTLNSFDNRIAVLTYLYSKF